MLLLTATEGALLERELQVSLSGIELCPFQGVLIALHQVQDFGFFDNQPGIDLPRIVDVEFDVDTVKLGWIKAHMEKSIAVGDLTRQFESELWQVELLLAGLIAGLNHARRDGVDPGRLRWDRGRRWGVGAGVTGRGGCDDERLVIALPVTGRPVVGIVAGGDELDQPIVRFAAIAGIDAAAGNALISIVVVGRRNSWCARGARLGLAHQRWFGQLEGWRGQHRYAGAGFQVRCRIEQFGQCGLEIGVKDLVGL